MRYPSLLFTEKASGSRVPMSVFADIKLTLFFSEDAIGAMRVLCRSEDIPVRQAMVRRLLEAPAALDWLRRLGTITGEIQRLRNALENVRCEHERHYVFVGLMAAVADFYALAAAPDSDGGAEAGGSLLCRFTQWFRAAAAESDWAEMARRAAELRARAQTARRESFRAQGDNLWMRRAYDEAYTDVLRRCAGELGLPPIPPRKDAAIRLDARMVNALARLYPQEFLAFKAFFEDYGTRFDEGILSYRYELNFYLEAAALLHRIRRAGLPLCWPTVSEEKRISVRSLRDISLLAKSDVEIIPNDADFSAAEPFFFLTGANGGGKTTYLRSLGIAALLFRSGCPVCADEASLWPMRNVFTHFPQDERFEGDGRYADERRRVDEILREQGGDSLVLLNETYSTTNEELAAASTVTLARTLIESGSLCLYITHQRGLEAAEAPYLSVIVDESEEHRRTYRIARRQNTAGSYAQDILLRYGLDAAGLERRCRLYQQQREGEGRT